MFFVSLVLPSPKKFTHNRCSVEMSGRTITEVICALGRRSKYDSKFPSNPVLWFCYRSVLKLLQKNIQHMVNCSLHTENLFDNLTRTALHSIMDFLYNKQQNKMQLAQSGSL